MNPPRWDQTVALFGGVFDPPHLGHRQAVQGLLTSPGVKSVMVLPAAVPPHKISTTQTHHRIQMARLCFENLRNVEVNLSELIRAEGTNRPSYSFETISELKQKVSHLAFVIGTDQLGSLPTWFRFPDLLKLCHWIVLARKPDGLGKIMELMQPFVASGLAAPANEPLLWTLTGGTFLTAVETAAPEVSSSQIREIIGRTGVPPSELLPAEIVAYLNETRLYGSNQMKFERSFK